MKDTDSSYHFYLTARSSTLLDIVFVVGTRTPEDFEKAKRSILSAVNTQTNNNPMYGVIQYDNVVTEEIPINKFLNLDGFKTRVKNLVWRDSGTLLEDGIDAGRRMLVEDGRPLARKLLLVLSDKDIQSNSSDLQESVDVATENSIKIVTVFFGKPVDQTKVTILTPNDPEPSIVSPTDNGDKIGPEITTKLFKGSCVIILLLQNA